MPINQQITVSRNYDLINLCLAENVVIQLDEERAEIVRTKLADYPKEKCERDTDGISLSVEDWGDSFGATLIIDSVAITLTEHEMEQLLNNLDNPTDVTDDEEEDAEEEELSLLEEETDVK